MSTYPGGLEALAKEYPKTFGETLFCEEMGEAMTNGYFGMIKNMFSSCVLVTKKFASKELADKMAAYLPQVIPVMESYLNNAGRIRSINHGDAWYNNFLYRFVKSSHLYKILNNSWKAWLNCVYSITPFMYFL